MSDNERLEDLLDRYQDLLDAGQNPSVHSLCREAPHLVPELQKKVTLLNRIGRVLDPDAPALEITHQEEPIPLSLSDDKTWVGRSDSDPHAPVEIPAPPGYEVLAPLGEGGMGIVYKAKQIGLNRLVALKMILAGTRARAVELARFRDEAKAIASLRHPNIVQVFEIGVYRNQPFFSLEYCPGSTLAKALKGEPQLPDTAAAMTEVLARAMDYAHSCGIVHRDLKPANVLLSSELGSGIAEPATIAQSPSDFSRSTIPVPSSSFKITDFGLAKRVDDDSGKTQDGSVIGTPSYMAPEQAFGKNNEINPATDVHALGAMLYEFLTGRPPFKGSTVHDTLEQVRYRNPVPVRELQPKVPRDLETICLKCLQKEPRKRYPSALALAEDLERFKTNKPIKARPTSRLENGWRWCRREPWTAAMVASIALFCISIPALFAWSYARLKSAEEMVEIHGASLAAAKRDQRLAREAEESLRYHAAVNDARRLHVDGKKGWTWDAREKLQNVASSGSSARDLHFLRSEWLATHANLDVRVNGSFAKGTAPGAFAFSKNGRLAIAPYLIQPFLSTRAVILIEPKTGREFRLPFTAPDPGAFQTDQAVKLEFSPDDRWLILGLRSGAVIRWDLSAPEPVRKAWQAHNERLTGLAVSPDSRSIYSASISGEVRRWPIELSTPKPDRRLSKGPGPNSEIGAMALWEGEPTGLLVNGPAGTKLLNLDTLAEITSSAAADRPWIRPQIPGANHGKLAVRPANGTVVAAEGRTVDVWFWQDGICRGLGSLCDSKLDLDCRAHANPVEVLALHPAGNILASASPSEGLVKLWCLATSKLLMTIPAVDARAVAFDPTGSLLAVAGEHVTTLYELSGFALRSTVARRGFAIRAFGDTHEGRLTTIASRPFTDSPDHASTVVSVWDANHRVLESIVHRQDQPHGQPERLASDPDAGITVWLPGDQFLHRQSELGKVGEPRKVGNVRDITIDPAGRCWTIEDNQKLFVQSLDNLKSKREIEIPSYGKGKKNLMCVKSGGTWIAVGTENGELWLLDANGKRLRDCHCYEATFAARVTERSNTVHTAALAPSAGLVAGGSEDGRIWLFDLATGRRTGVLQAHDDRVTSIAFDSTGAWLVTGSRDGLVRVWRRGPSGFEPYTSLESTEAGPVRQVQFDPLDKQIRVLHERETAIRVWHLDRIEASFKEAGLSQ